MARHAWLEGRRDLSVVTVGELPDSRSSAGVNLEICQRLGVEVLAWDSPALSDRLSAAAWVIDGLTGTGLKGPLRDPLAEVATAVSEAPARVAAVDVPSGLRDGFQTGDPLLPADITVTMGLPKLCLYLPTVRVSCGEIRVAKVGFPPDLLSAADIPGRLLTPEGILPLPSLPEDSYKGKRGHLAVLAGSPGTTGAAWLGAHAAARSRVGLVTVYLESRAYAVGASSYSSVMVKEGDPGEELEGYSAFLAGPGWGFGPGRQGLLDRLIKTSLPGVVDADGITMLSQRDEETPLGENRVITPHPGEMARLLGSTVPEVLCDPLGALDQVRRRLGCTAVLKSHVTHVMSADGAYCILDGMNPWMGTGGSGDVLAGLVGGFLAQGMESFQAASTAVLVHSEAGRLARGQIGSFLAEDLLQPISALVADPGEGR
jgi:NAD(P)H-hydrate epimerase